MNPHSTWRWFLVAVILFAAICLLKYHVPAGGGAGVNGWPILRLADATSVTVIPAGALEIKADRTNDNWVLSKPYAYPAQNAAIRAFLDTLAKLTPATRITASELRDQPNAGQDYGFDNPQESLVLTTPAHEWQLIVGRRTPPGDQVFVRIVGVDGAFVLDSAWLKFLPQSAMEWRDTALVVSDVAYDWIVLTNGARQIELHEDPTNHLWHMTRPLQARADSDRINRAIEQLRSAKVDIFVTDESHPELAAYGLQPADLDLWLGHDGQLTEGLHTGKTLTNNSALVFAKREGWDGIITTLKEPLLPWHGTLNEFRDPHLINLTEPVNEIDVSVAATTNQFSLRNTDHGWQVAGSTFPVDVDSVQFLIKSLAGMTNLEYEDAVTTPDLQKYGLDRPYMEITVRPTAGDTNHALAQLSFSVLTNAIYAHRSDEDVIYRMDPAVLNQIPEGGWEFRDRKIWRFKEQDITKITVHQGGQTREILHAARDQWSLAAGSSGQVYGPTIEETAHQLGDLTAIGWVGHNVSPANYGATAQSLSIEVTLKDGQSFKLFMGGTYYGQPLGLVALDGSTWAFILPAGVDELILSYLTIPANVP